jgi:hypothetical protein
VIVTSTGYPCCGERSSLNGSFAPCVNEGMHGWLINGLIPSETMAELLLET